MKKIAEIDRSMAVCARIEDTDICWYDVRQEPFSVHGLFRPCEEGPFRRLPADVAQATNEGVEQLALNTAGGRVRFATDSPYVAIHAEMSNVCRMDHMPFTGIFGFDLYCRMDGEECYRGTFRPPVDMTGGYESKLMLPEAPVNEVTVNMPLYNGVDRLLIGVKEGSAISAPRAYTRPKPVVYYGSSITQGGCASRPGSSYQAIISRELDCDYVNLGFSGSAKGEEAIVEYMSGMDMSVFVCDYDHNAPTPEHLRKTHLPLYRAIRARQPELPIIFVTKPDAYLHEGEADLRRAIIRATYEQALSEGDRKVAFLDGDKLFEGPGWRDCTVDGCHPNDLGFFRMAQVIGGELKKWI